jgi:PKD domain
MSSKGRGRRGPLLAVALCAAMLVLALGATGADAIVAKIGGHGYGVTPIKGVNPASIGSASRALGPGALFGSGRARNQDGSPLGGGPLLYGGGPVMHSNTTHVIYWDPNKEFKPTTKAIIKGFFTNVAHDSGLGSNVFAPTGQYTDTTGSAVYGSSFGGEAVDETGYPLVSGCNVPVGGDQGPPYTKCLTDAELQTELSSFITKEKMPTGPTQLYFVLLPHKVVTCLPEVVGGEQVCSNNFYCAYHSWINPGTPGEIIFSDIPFSLLDSVNAKGCQDDGHAANLQQPNPDNEGGENKETRFADVALKYIGHEWVEATTDPLVNNKTAWVDENGLENGDKCNGVHGNGSGVGYDPNAFLPVLGGEFPSNNLFNQSINEGHYYLQSEWDNAAKACTMKPVPIGAAAFTTAPSSPSAGAPVSFKGTATDVYARLRFLWKWGDGTESVGATPTHVYGATGSYEVTMTPTDELTFATASPVVHTVVVKLAQSIKFTSSPPASAIVSGPTYQASAEATSGLPVSLTVDASSSSVCSVTGSTVSFIGAGTCTIDANQSGNGTYSTGAQAQQSFSVAPAPLPPASPAGSIVTAPIVTTPIVTAPILTPPAATSSFTAGAISVDATTGSVTFSESVSNTGTFSWLLTFHNGKFGVFSASTSRCKKGSVRLNGKCRPSKIVFASGKKFVSGPGTVSFSFKPSPSALKALRNAMKRKKGIPVTGMLTFQSSLGGNPVSQPQSLVVKLRKK